MSKIPFLYRSLLALGVFGIHSLSILAEWYTNLWLGILLGVVTGWLVNGLFYGVFAGKLAIKETPGGLKDTRTFQPGGSSLRSRTIGYWIMTAIIIAISVAVPIAKKFME